ncbi:MAG: tetratricopeptide repeat protein [Deltaproteobacteria bacterium]|nr:tetratricopeptide repeat protein [Deltaproteobacteria bacterium]
MLRKKLIVGLIICLLATPALAKKKILPSEQAVFHNNQGINYLNKQDLERALFEFQSAIELAPQFAAPYNNIGIIYKIQGEYPKAIEYFQLAIKQDKKYAAPYNHLAAVQLALGDLQAALAMAQKAVKKDPLLADARYNLGIVYYELHRSDPKLKKYRTKAEEAFKKATVLNPNLFAVHLRLAEMYTEDKKYDLAVVRYRLALNVTNDPDTWQALGHLYQLMGDPFKAQNCFQQAAALDPLADEAFVEIGIFYVRQKYLQEAREAFAQAINVNPKNEKAHLHLGSIDLEEKNLEEAVEHFQKAKAVNPNEPEAPYNLGVTYLEMGSTEKARKEWEYVLKIAPSYPRALYNLGLLSGKEGKKKESAQYYCDFLKAAKGDFPTKEELVEKILEDEGIRCPH